MVLALAACDTVSSLTGRPAGGESPPSQIIAASPLPLAPAERGRAVARVPTDSQPEPTPPAIVVRGREPDTRPRIAVPDHSGKSGDVTLNFAGADIRDVVAAILGDALKVNYVVDPEVMGPVTININRPLPRDELLSTLEAVLNSRGATMVQNNGIVRVMPLRKEGKPGSAAPIISSPSAPVGQNNGVFNLRYVSATEMQHVLEKVLPPGQVITADDQRRMLVVQGSPTELKLAEDTVRIFDIDQLSGMSMALVPLSRAEPAAMADELKNIFLATRKEADNSTIRFMAVARLNAVMILSRSARYMDEARSWIARLDRERNPNERKVYVYNLQYAKAVQVGQKLQGLLTGIDIQFKAPGPAAADGLAAPNGVESGDNKEGVIKASTGSKPPAPVPAAAPVPVPAAAPGPGDRNTVRVEADESHNALLISASGRDYELIRQVLEGIDVPPLQVLIEVTVAEVALNDKLNYGVQYFINSGRGNVLLTTGQSALGITPPVPGFALAYVTGNFQPRVILDLLSDVTQTKVISTPRLLVLSNQTARLQVGDVVPIITQSATSTVTSNPLILNNVTYKETGVVLEVTPRVNAGGFVTLDVNQSVSDVVNTTTSKIDSPTIRQRRLVSTISVKSGETILLGGLIKQADNRENSGIPVLNEIPGVGALFGSRANSAERTELILLLTPRVVSNEAEARDLTAFISQQFSAALDGSPMVKPRLPAR